MILSEVLIKPILTEKANSQQDKLPRYAFKVAKKANKLEIKKAVESILWCNRDECKHQCAVVSKHLEMGQGTYTGLATIVAEELDADWSRVHVEGAPADGSKFNNLFWGPTQGTGGRSSIANSWPQLRAAGATARAMLVAAAAAEWKVDAAGLTTENGVVTNPATGKRLSYGSLARAAAALPVPEKVTLKDPASFRLVGRQAPRVDARPKSTGKAIFTQDVALPGMLTAVVAHPPRFGATVYRAFPTTAL